MDENHNIVVNARYFNNLLMEFRGNVEMTSQLFNAISGQKVSVMHLFWGDKKAIICNWVWEFFFLPFSRISRTQKLEVFIFHLWNFSKGKIACIFIWKLYHLWSLVVLCLTNLKTFDCCSCRIFAKVIICVSFFFQHRYSQIYQNTLWTLNLA